MGGSRGKDLVDKILDKHNLNPTQRNIMKSMMLAGASERDAKASIKGYGSSSSGKLAKQPNSMVCPRCTSPMRMVALADGRPARYCPNDRVCLPIKNRTRD